MLKIANKEILYLLYSPIGWFVMTVFVIQCGLLYFEPLSHWVYLQDMLHKNSPGFVGFRNSLTETIFTEGKFFSTIFQNLYLFVPLLTMGVISREVNSGSIRLLLSSPLTIRQVVLGKYLGVMLYIGILTAILLLPVLSGITGIKHSDHGMLFSGALAFFLLGAAYVAIGLFMSAISSNAIVSAISVFVVLFVLSFIGTVGQRYDLLRDLTYFLSLHGQAENLANGLIVSKDIIYFIAIVALFIGFTLMRLRSCRDGWSRYKEAWGYLLTLFMILGAGYLTSRPAFTLYADVTSRQTNTIHPRTQQLIKGLGDRPLRVSLYVNLLDRETLGYGLPQSRNAIFLKFWERYLRFKPNIEFKYIYYYYRSPNDSVFNQIMANSGKSMQQIAHETADILGYDLDMFRPIDSVPELRGEHPEECRLLMRMQEGKQSQWLRLYKTPYPDAPFPPSESNIYATLKQLSEPSPRVYFTTGHLERSIYKNGDRDYRFLAWSQEGLASNGFQIDTLNLSSQRIPDSADILIIADPKIPFASRETDEIQRFTASGRNLMILGHPGKQPLLNPMLAQIGAMLSPGQLVMPTWDETPDKVASYVPADADGFAEELSGIKKYLQKGDTQLLIRSTPSTTAVIPTNDSLASAVTTTAMLKTLPQSAWIKAGPFKVDSTLPPFDSAAGDWKINSFMTAAAVSRSIKGKEQRVVVLGGADVFDNRHIAGNSRTTAHTLVRWLNYGKNPVYLPRKKAEDTSLRLSGPLALAQQIIYMGVLPLVMLAGGTLLIIRRKRR